MRGQMSEPGVIKAERVDRCQLCGAIAETRPYGPNGQEVCFDCGMEDEAAAEEHFCQHVFGHGIPRKRVRKNAAERSKE